MRRSDPVGLFDRTVGYFDTDVGLFDIAVEHFDTAVELTDNGVGYFDTTVGLSGAVELFDERQKRTADNQVNDEVAVGYFDDIYRYI